jgi:phosphotransferase system enzyme I (PtsI)
MHKGKNQEVRLSGRTISSGIAIGFACLEELNEEIPRYAISIDETDAELERLEWARDVLQENLLEHILLAHSACDEDMENVLKYHEMMLQDESLFQKIEADIRKQNKNAEWAIWDQATAVVTHFETMRDPYFQARAEDIRDLAESLLRTLIQKDTKPDCSAEPDRPRILVSRNLYATSAVRARKLNAAGFLTASSAFVSHGAILLKGLGIPVLGGVEGLPSRVQDGDEIILDGMTGEAIIRPSLETRAKYISLQQRGSYPSGTYTEPPKELKTRDGTAVRLLANIEHPNQITLALDHGLKGIGLFRTEFLALLKNAIPDEEEQCQLYESVYDQAKGRLVVFRTLDIGADKQTRDLHRCVGRNPAMGIRGIRRHIMRNPEEIQIQLRAILRAAQGRTAHVMFPLITNLADVQSAKRFVDEAEESLVQRSIPHADEIRMGMMLEVPSAVFLVQEILEEVDFVSVGTNDLLQYFTASDRDNPAMFRYQDAKDPAFIRLLKYLATQIGSLGRLDDVTVCGEIASSPEMIPFLLDCGYRSLSVSPVAAKGIQKQVSEHTLSGSRPNAIGSGS